MIESFTVPSKDCEKENNGNNNNRIRDFGI